MGSNKLSIKNTIAIGLLLFIGLFGYILLGLNWLFTNQEKPLIIQSKSLNISYEACSEDKSICAKLENYQYHKAELFNFSSKSEFYPVITLKKIDTNGNKTENEAWSVMGKSYTLDQIKKVSFKWQAKTQSFDLIIGSELIRFQVPTN